MPRRTIPDDTVDGLKRRLRDLERGLADERRVRHPPAAYREAGLPGSSVPVFRFDTQHDAPSFSWSVTEHMNYGGAVQRVPGPGGMFSTDYIEVVTPGIYRVSVGTRFVSNDPFGVFTVPSDTEGLAWIMFASIDATQPNPHLPYALVKLDAIFSVEVAGSVSGIVALQAGDRFLGTTEIYYQSAAIGESRNFLHTSTVGGELLWPDESVVSDFVPSVG